MVVPIAVMELMYISAYLLVFSMVFLFRPLGFLVFLLNVCFH